jgi:heme exporter protein CcmD
VLDFKAFTSAGDHSVYIWCAYGFVLVAIVGGVLTAKRGLQRALARAVRQIEQATDKTPSSEH